MKEQIKEFWKEHKETIKTGTILVLTPIAVIGLKSTLDLSKIVDMAYHESKKDNK